MIKCPNCKADKWNEIDEVIICECGYEVVSYSKKIDELLSNAN
jgi:hypothetical protein